MSELTLQTAPDLVLPVISTGEFTRRWRDGDFRSKESLGVAVRQAIPGPPVMKAMVDEKEGLDFQWVISGGDQRDLDHEWVNPRGIDWTGYLKGRGEGGLAPVLFAHQTRLLPVAGTSAIEVEGQKQVATGRFFSDHELGESGAAADLGRACRRLAPTGVMRASISFIPLAEAVTWNEKEEGLDFNAGTGVEWSLLPVAAYEGSRRLALSAGATEKDLKIVRTAVVKMLDGEDPDGRFLPRDLLEKTALELGKGRKFFTLSLDAIRQGLDTEDEEVKTEGKTSTSGPEPPKPKARSTIAIGKCPHCGGTHEAIEVRPRQKKPGMLGACPEVEEPIFVEVRATAVPPELAPAQDIQTAEFDLNAELPPNVEKQVAAAVQKLVNQRLEELTGLVSEEED